VTLNLGYFGAPTLILGNAVNPACNLQVAGLQVFDVIGNWGSSALGVLATVTGLPTSGVAEIFRRTGAVVTAQPGGSSLITVAVQLPGAPFQIVAGTLVPADARTGPVPMLAPVARLLTPCSRCPIPTEPSRRVRA